MSSYPPAKVVMAKRLFFLAAFISFVLSVTLYFLLDEPRMGIFVGLWVPSILSFGNLALAGGKQS